MSLYYADPDGNQIELKVDNFDTYEEQHAWMRSAAFAHNPIGAPFDMDALAAQLRAGVPARQLVHLTTAVAARPAPADRAQMAGRRTAPDA